MTYDADIRGELLAPSSGGAHDFERQTHTGPDLALEGPINAIDIRAVGEPEPLVTGAESNSVATASSFDGLLSALKKIEERGEQTKNPDRERVVSLLKPKKAKIEYVNRPMDDLVTVIEPDQAVQFVGMVEQAVSIVGSKKIDIVVAPLRGAGPVVKAMSEFMDVKGKRKPKFVEPAIGTSEDIVSGQDFGLKRSQKSKLVSDTLDDLAKTREYEPGKSRIMILDEAQKGGTITQVAKSVRHATRTYGDERVIEVLSIQDVRGKIAGLAKVEDYTKLTANEVEGFRTSVISTQLFTVDRHVYLDKVLADREKVKGAGLDLEVSDLNRVENTEASSLFEALVRVYIDPEKAQEEIESIELLERLGGSACQELIADVITDPRGNISGEADQEKILSWWKRYIDLIKQQSVDGKKQ